MIKGTIDGYNFEIDSGKVISDDKEYKALIEELKGIVFNPITYETYMANINNDMDAYLLLCDLKNRVNMDIKINKETIPIWDNEVNKTY
ncbi:MAG: hypothetical protein QME45_04310 [Clostridiales bacterium]|nr:hypothetical protein [Clostridiales bacterium]